MANLAYVDGKLNHKEDVFIINVFPSFSWKDFIFMVWNKLLIMSTILLQYYVKKTTENAYFNCKQLQ